jgi:ribosomal protein S18 acetylase RimI-like enzyme
MIVRDYCSLDRNQLSEIFVLSRKFAYPWLDPKTFVESDFVRETEGERLWVCELDDEVVGFVSVWEPENFVHHIYLHPNFVRQGYGKILLDSAISKLSGVVTLKCQKRNTRAFEFYRATGWKEIGAGHSEEGEYHVMEYGDHA